MNLLEYQRLIFKHWKTLALSTFACLIIGILICIFMPKVYETNAKILIAQDNMSMLGSSPLEDVMLSSLGKSDPMSTQMEIIKTRPIVSKVIDTLKMFDEKGVILDPDIFVKKYKISILRNTNIIDVKSRFRNADTVALFVNLIASVYVKNNQSMNQEAMAMATNFLEQQLIGQKAKVQAADEALISFKEKTKTVSLIKETDVNIEALSNIMTEKIKTESELNGVLEQQIVYKKKLSAPDAQTSPSYSIWSTFSEQLDNSITGLKGKLDNINMQISKQQASMINMPATEVKLAQLVREQLVASEIYTSLLVKYQEYKVQEVAQMGSAKIIEPAVVPIKPILPKKKIVLILSFLLGLCLSASVVFLLDYLKGSAKSIEEVKRILGYSVLGMVPYVNDKIRLFLNDKHSFRNEAMKLIKTNLKFKMKINDNFNDKSNNDKYSFDNKCKVIMVTSAQPGEGKSTISANLAFHFSKSDKTLLMGLDLRRPTFDNIFDIKLEKGLTDLLVDEQVEFYKYDKTLDVLGPGTLPADPLDVVVSKKMERLLSKLKQSYDVIIIDTAPITLVAETLEIAKMADNIIVVIDISEISLKSLQDVKNSFEEKQLPVPSLIMNKCGKDLLGKYSSNQYYSKN